MTDLEQLDSLVDKLTLEQLDSFVDNLIELRCVLRAKQWDEDRKNYKPPTNIRSEYADLFADGHDILDKILFEAFDPPPFVMYKKRGDDG